MEFKDLWDYLNTLETFEELNESKFSIKGEKSHNKHLDKNKRDYQTKENGSRFHNITFDQYNENGDILSKKSVKTSDINSKDRFIGFYGKDNAIYKYDKQNREFIIYVAQSPKKCYTITYFKASLKYYENKKRKMYLRELVPEDDRYNK